MQNYLLVFLGAGAGGALRHAFNFGFARLLPNTIGASTLLVNVLGSFLMGMLIEWLASKGEATQGARLFLATGLLGGFTTFSAFSLETVLLYERGQIGWAAIYIFASVAISLVALIAGLALVRYFAH
jgi:fluoride exporter